MRGSRRMARPFRPAWLAIRPVVDRRAVDGLVVAAAAVASEVDMITFFVPGVPVPQGSMRAFVNRHTRRAVVTSDNAGLKGWRNTVSTAAALAFSGPALLDQPVSVTLRFFLPRPASVKRNKRAFPVVKPDLDKLVRAVFDALTGSVLVDDALICGATSYKSYADDHPAGVEVTVRVIETVAA